MSWLENKVIQNIKDACTPSEWKDYQRSDYLERDRYLVGPKFHYAIKKLQGLYKK
jgi:hypothetical protein